MNLEEMEILIQELQERVSMLEFREEQMMEQSHVSEVILDYHINREQYRKIMDLMDKYREQIEEKNEVSNAKFEDEIYDIFGGYRKATQRKYPIEYHFCEYIAKAFMDDGRWEEVYLKDEDNE